MPNFPAGFLVGSLLAATLILPTSSAQAGASSAWGHAVVGVGDDVLRILSFDAASVNPDEGTATGQIEFHDPQPSANQDVDGTGDSKLEDAPGGVRLQANVDCLFVDGHHAVIGGQVTSATVSRYVGMWVLLYAEDSDGHKPDKLSWGFYPAETDTGCGTFPVAAFDEAVEIESGDLQVQQ